VRRGLVLCLLVVLSIVAAGCTDSGTANADAASVANEPLEGNVTIAEVVNNTVVREVFLEGDVVREMPSYTAHGFAVSTVGIKYGPYVCRGVQLSELCDQVGGVGENDTVWVSAPDGYLWVFDYTQMNGEAFVTFDEDLHEISSPPLTIMLMYEKDDHYLTYNEGGAFRIAVTSEEAGVVTEGSCWVKWVDRIEVHRK
jgi:hypothetical protein